MIETDGLSMIGEIAFGISVYLIIGISWMSICRYFGYFWIDSPTEFKWLVLAVCWPLVYAQLVWSHFKK